MRIFIRKARICNIFFCLGLVRKLQKQKKKKKNRRTELKSCNLCVCVCVFFFLFIYLIKLCAILIKGLMNQLYVLHSLDIFRSSLTIFHVRSIMTFMYLRVACALWESCKMASNDIRLKTVAQQRPCSRHVRTFHPLFF